MLKKILLGFGLGLGAAGSAQATQELLNVSYDVSRNFYKDFNQAFAAHWKHLSGTEITIHQSHGGSSKQARSVIDGLEADVVTMNNPLDIDAIAEKSRAVSSDWPAQYAHNAAPSWSAILFVVRKGNPKGIKDWGDLARPGVSVIIPNPKTSGNGRYSYLSAWEWAKRRNNGNETAAREFIAQLFANVPILDTGGRGATTTFSQRGIGDALLTFENEVQLILSELGDRFEVVVPSLTARADNPVALVSKYAGKHGTKNAAHAYLQFHYSDKAQEIFSNNHIRPLNDVILQKYAHRFPALNTFDVTQVYGSWKQAQALHFADGGTFDQIYLKK